MCYENKPEIGSTYHHLPTPGTNTSVLDHFRDIALQRALRLTLRTLASIDLSTYGFDDDSNVQANTFHRVDTYCPGQRVTT